jgi:hypothetical protein
MGFTSSRLRLELVNAHTDQPLILYILLIRSRELAKYDTVFSTGSTVNRFNRDRT